MSYEQQNRYYQGPAQEAGHGYNQDQYELQNRGDNSFNQTSQQSHSRVLPLRPFLDRIQQLQEEVKSLATSIEYIGQLHQRALSSTGSQAKDQAENYVTQTKVQTTAIKDGIKSLEQDLVNTTDNDRNTKNSQLQSLKTQFKSVLAKYESVEHEYRKNYRQQLRRQLDIAYPDASEPQIQQLMESDWSNEGVFQTALKDSRTGQASSVLGNVRARHNELQRIEQTLAELAVLYQELAAAVEQQDVGVEAIEENAIRTEENMAAGNTNIEKANASARRARKLKWWCLLLVIVIIIAIALGVGLGICLTGNTCKSK
ncbi:hypothetical protein QQS21_002177 [Conoideocrella luteorostrata]|uniref:t-SNARE coiled-coil homology domain-containing protein n=1 Tax=Conoideocrella luteorostrata TaxID=1105319 RepID=A0AAJ0FXI3_9HYPO|nr:hypothetical protein QQS21_002177 [Conoideocrella luteorostrata]